MELKKRVQQIDLLAQWLRNSTRLRERRPFAANLWNETALLSLVCLVVFDLNETNRRYLYTTAATRSILLFTASALIFTLTRTAAEPPSGLSD
jgi:hypothetical protein